MYFVALQHTVLHCNTHVFIVCTNHQKMILDIICAFLYLLSILVLIDNRTLLFSVYVAIFDVMVIRYCLVTINYVLCMQNKNYMALFCIKMCIPSQKLQQISTLKEQQAQGKTLEKNQVIFVWVIKILSATNLPISSQIFVYLDVRSCY